MSDAKSTTEHQKILSPPMQDIVKNEIFKLLDVGVIYPIVKNIWVCHVQCVPKKCGMIVVPNERSELVSMRPRTSLRVCMDYRKLIYWTE